MPTQTKLKNGTVHDKTATKQRSLFRSVTDSKGNIHNYIGKRHVSTISAYTIELNKKFQQKTHLNKKKKLERYREHKRKMKENIFYTPEFRFTHERNEFYDWLHSMKTDFLLDYSPPVTDADIRYIHALLNECSDCYLVPAHLLKDRLKKKINTESIKDIDNEQLIKAKNILKTAITAKNPNYKFNY